MHATSSGIMHDDIIQVIHNSVSTGCLLCWLTRVARALLCLGSESAMDVKAALRFASAKPELQRWASIRLQLAKEQSINTLDNCQHGCSLRKMACSAQSLQLRTVQNQQLFCIYHGDHHDTSSMFQVWNVHYIIDILEWYHHITHVSSWCLAWVVLYS